MNEFKVFNEHTVVDSTCVHVRFQQYEAVLQRLSTGATHLMWHKPRREGNNLYPTLKDAVYAMLYHMGVIPR